MLAAEVIERDEPLRFYAQAGFQAGIKTGFIATCS